MVELICIIDHACTVRVIEVALVTYRGMEAVLVFLVQYEANSSSEDEDYDDEENQSHWGSWMGRGFADDSAAAVGAGGLSPGAAAGEHDCTQLCAVKRMLSL